MSDWNDIKNKISYLNDKTKLSPIDKKPLDNELIMCLFINKVNLKFRFEPYYEVPFLDYTTRMFNTVIDNYENRTNVENFFEVAKKDTMIKTYIDSIKNTLITKIKIDAINKPDIKKYISDLINQNNNKNKEEILDLIINNFDINLILCSALEFLDMRKYKILSKMLYNVDNQGYKYLDYAKESIINSNKNKSLDQIVFGINITEHMSRNIKENFGGYHINFILIIILFLLLIYMTLTFVRKL
jgi:hypothetical protein